MLWVHPDIYTLKQLLEVYPKARLFDSMAKRIVSYEEIAELTQKDKGAEPLVDDIRWDNLYLIDPDGEVVPLSAGEMQLETQNDQLRQKLSDLEFNLDQLKKQIEHDRFSRFINGLLVGVGSAILLQALWRLISHG